MKIVPIAEVPVEDADACRRAVASALLEAARDLLIRFGVEAVILPEGRGTARLTNLLCWHVSSRRELLERESVTADQLVHFALHQWIDARLGHEQPRAVLFAETVASASDFLLLGKLASLDPEPPFVIETIESFGYYYELYATEENALERLLTAALSDPFATMGRVCRFLYEAAVPLLEERDVAMTARHLEKVSRDDLYPLLHHYNMANWIATIRAGSSGVVDIAFDPFPALPDSEAALLDALRSVNPMKP